MSLDQFSLKENIALVTGASSGIGHAVAKGLASAGATIIAAARRIDRLEQLVADIEAGGGQAMAVRPDVTDSDNIKQALDLAALSTSPRCSGSVPPWQRTKTGPR